MPSAEGTGTTIKEHTFRIALEPINEAERIRWCAVGGCQAQVLFADEDRWVCWPHGQGALRQDRGWWTHEVLTATVREDPPPPPPPPIEGEAAAFARTRLVGDRHRGRGFGGEAVSPEERIQEGEYLILKVLGSKVRSWVRFKALHDWGAWTRKHGCALIRFARRAERERKELLQINKRLQVMFDDVVEQRDKQRRCRESETDG